MSIIILEEYIETGNYQDLELLITKNPDLLKDKTSHDISPLLLACYYNKHQIIQIILKHTSIITIHEACAVGLTEQVQMMLEHKKEIANEISNTGMTPLSIATHFNKENIVRLLLLHHADPNICSQNGFFVFPIHTALAANNESIGKLLIEAGADVNVRQKGNITPLQLASQFGNIELIITLLEQGADINIRNDSGESASDIAAKKGFKEIAEILKIN